MNRTFVFLASILAGLSVAAGAFGAHALGGTLAPNLLNDFETAARYQMYHALALLVIGLLGDRLSPRLSQVAGWLFVAGIAFFSGSLYLLALTGVRIFGAITPIGGVAFLAGWVVLAWAVVRGQ